MQISQLNIPDDVIDLGAGQPDPNLLPLAFMRRAIQHRMRRARKATLQYGTEQGNAYFRTDLARYLSHGYRSEVDPDHLMITAGATHGLDLACTYFASPGDTILVEEPSYFLALRIFRDRHLNMVPISIDSEGPVIDDVEAALKSVHPVFFYTIPTFHNPAGVTMTLRRRRQLLELSREHGFMIVADEVYQLLSYGYEPPPPMAALDTDARVLGLGSFSKILAPGLRLGWIQAQPELLARMTGGGLLLSSGGMNPFTSSLVQSVIETGLQHEYLDNLKSVYQQRADGMISALRHHLPQSAMFTPPRGGFFIWLQLATSINTRSLRKRAVSAGVNFQPGTSFSVRQRLGGCMRLCFVYYSSQRLVEGVRRLSEVLADTGE